MYRLAALLIVPVLAMGLLAAFDVLREPPPRDPIEVGLDIAEKLLIVAAMAAVAWTVLRVDRLRQDHAALRAQMERATAQGEAWRNARAREISAMGEAIAAEFRSWGLSPAEADVAGLLLKGCSMKEIALARDTSEATIRQQAQSVYRKAGLSGRSELSAYFLDSLFASAERPPLRAI